MPAPAATKKAIERAISAATACGLTVTSFTVEKDGSIHVTTAPARKPCDDGRDAGHVDSAASNVRPLVPKQWKR